MAESEEECKSLLIMMKKSETDDLKLNLQKTKIRAAGPMKNRRGKSGNSARIYFLVLQNHC